MARLCLKQVISGRSGAEEVFRIALMRKCFLHVGTHKTGTTSIQHMLSSKTVALQTKGYYYPRAGQPDSSLPGHHNIAWEISGDVRFRRDSGRIDDLMSEITERPETVILSSEDFSGALYCPSFREFVNSLGLVGFDVTLIMYLRNQLDWFPRAFLTLIQAGWDVGWRESLAMKIGPSSQAFRILQNAGGDPTQRKSLFRDYADLIKRAHDSRALKVVVRSYDLAQHSVCSDFLSIFGLTVADLNMEREIRVNSSLPLREYLLIFARNRMRRDLGEKERNAIHALVPAEETRIKLSPAEQRKLLELFRETSRSLQQDYGIPEPTIDYNAHTDWCIDTLFSEAVMSQVLPLPE